MERGTIRLEMPLIEKIKEIQGINGYKSINETVKQILPKGTTTPEEFVKEQPAFTLVSSNDEALNISWNELRESDVGTKWDNDEKATILFKDDGGVLIRFEDEYGEIYITYFHFLWFIQKTP